MHASVRLPRLRAVGETHTIRTDQSSFSVWSTHAAPSTSRSVVITSSTSSTVRSCLRSSSGGPTRLPVSGSTSSMMCRYSALADACGYGSKYNPVDLDHFDRAANARASAFMSSMSLTASLSSLGAPLLPSTSTLNLCQLRSFLSRRKRCRSGRGTQPSLPSFSDSFGAAGATSAAAPPSKDSRSADGSTRVRLGFHVASRNGWPLSLLARHMASFSSRSSGCDSSTLALDRRAKKDGTASPLAGLVESTSLSMTPTPASSRLSALTFSTLSDWRARMKASAVLSVE
mmetsp:Transcript_2675/g.8938  ORF Transcript_2675/g.8938 Transcript_2675/m.8938 type:complete len:287 (+) Transcript_2675:1731-2591(+)